MYTLKGFVVMQALSNNAVPRAIAPLGELSTYSKTFSRNIGHYSQSTSPDVDFYSFSSRDDVSEFSEVDTGTSELILTLSQWLYTQALGGAFTEDVAAFVAAVLTEHDVSIADLDAGPMVAGGNGVYLPQWISFSSRARLDEHRIKLWFSDDAFRRQYDEYEITIVPPLDNVDDLLALPVLVKAKLDAIDRSEQAVRVQLAKDNDPTTIDGVELFEWSNPLDTSFKLTLPFTFLHYGPAGNTIDNRRRALVEYILANSARPETEWADFIPDLFKYTEFVITPLWDMRSIPNETLQTGLNTPTVLYRDMLTRALATAPNYTQEHIAQHLASSVSMYKSMSFLSVGGPDNRDGIMDYHQRFMDYIVVPSTSIEFGRMSPKTQEWVTLLTRMLRVAETMSEFTDVPLDMSRLIRNDIMYVVATFDDVQYLVVSQESYNQLFNIQEPEA